MWYNRIAWGSFVLQSSPLRRLGKENKFLFSLLVGDSPSGKALGSGPSIRGFESLIPSQRNSSTFGWSYFSVVG